jgi:hypothetical protein
MVIASPQGVEVIHLAESFRSTKLVGRTVHWAEHQLRHPLNIPRDHAARLNGRLVRPGDSLLPGDVLEFHARRGQKGLDELLTPEEFMAFTGFRPEEFEFLCARGMPVVDFGGSQQLVMAEVGKWLRGQDGVFAVAARRAFAKARLRIDQREGVATFDGTPYHITFEQALILLTLLEHLGEWVSTNELKAKHDDFLPKRMDRSVTRLPERLGKLIERNRKGYRLRL